ncbi:MAG: glycosyltransferase [Clostridia bacterium]|nr:glycosyltransferase [Clostridia bacterium]
MRVMHINAVYGVGSTGVIVEDLHNLAFQNGIDSYVSYSTTNKDVDEIKNGYQIGSDLDKKVHAFLCRIGGKQGYYSSFSTKKLIKHIELVSPDIVHLHNLHSNYIHLNKLLDYLAEKDVKIIITLHDCWFYTGGCFHYTADNCFKWIDSCGNCPKRLKDTPAYLKDNSQKILADRKRFFSGIKNLTVVGVSNWIAEEAKKTFFKDKDVFVIYNGVDTEFFVPTESNLREQYRLENKFVILGAANKWLSPINKDTFDFVTTNLPDDCVLVIIGCKEEQKADLPKNVFPLGYISDRDELRKIYSMADVFANCTREESLSLINVEAQSCGTPVVTYRNTGAQETVDNKCGFSVESGNAEDFFNKILSVKEIGKNILSKDCYKWVKLNFDRNVNYERYIDLYKSI